MEMENNVDNGYKLPIENEMTLLDRFKMLQNQLQEANVQVGNLIAELESNPNFPDGHIITKESWNSADKIIHDGFVYAKYSDLLFYK